MPTLQKQPFLLLPGLATEKGQAVARIGWTLLFITYLIYTSGFEIASKYGIAWALISAHFVFALMVLASLCENRRDSALRRIVALVFDQCMLATILYYTDEIAAPFILVPLFFTFGSGIRYGRKNAVFSSLLSAALIGIVLAFSSYWKQYGSIRAGLLMALIYLPLYVFALTDALALDMHTDSLTKLRNRIGFDELVKKMCRSALMAKSDSAIVFVDLDGFKRVNDEQGHDSGDAVLTHVAYWLDGELAPFGTSARFGGDEFAVVVRHLNSRSDLEAALTRFLQRVASVGQLFDSDLGASIGVYYVSPGSDVVPSFVYKAADQLMYRAKKLGKAQFVTSTGRLFSPDGYLLDAPGLSENGIESLARAL